MIYKKYLYLILITSVIFCVYSINYFLKQKKNITSQTTRYIKPSIIKDIAQDIDINLFIPYWNIPDNYQQLYFPKIDQYQNLTNLIYFGVKPNLTGIDKTDQGYKNINDFSRIKLPETVKKQLVLRMIDSSELNINAILSDQKKQNQIINDVIVIAQQDNFNGILIDLELAPPATLKKTNQVTFFIEIASKKIRAARLDFGIIIPLDIFSRNRPYDLTALRDYVDSIYFMAYDLHKPLGTPGPNFPLFGKEKYIDDIASALDKITRIINKDKINIVFGLFGYDWLVDIKKRPIKSAQAIDLTEIDENFIKNCFWKNCVINKDELSTETEVNYVDNNNELHIVWFDNESSISNKIRYCQLQNINKFSYWTWSYY